VGRQRDTTTDEAPLPALLRAARATFGSVIRRQLTDAGYDDIPPNGLFVLGAVGDGSTPLADVILALGASKQTAGALVDSLVVRGYLDRRPDPVDRRRLVVLLTDRGADAAAVIRATVSDLEASLEAAVGPGAVSGMRRALVALAGMGQQDG
jgi:DNA-binding MarR family transcriptional regulator